MSLVTVLDLSLNFSRKDLFKNVGFQVEPGDRIGLIGPNGSGKTSLLRLLVKEISPDSGEIRIAEGTRIGYLPQDVHETMSGTLLQSLLDSIPGRVRLRNEAAKIEESLHESFTKQEQEKLAVSLAETHHEMNHLDEQFPLHKAEKILLGLGFRSDDLEMPVSSLSGGWKMRASLGGILYQNPDLLLLDEPTNHLDIPSVRWLEQFLQDYRGALMLVCHDRDFLNRQIERVVSFEPEGMKSYNGNYDLYLEAREEERKTLEAKTRNQEVKIKEAKKFIERFRAKATKARQAQSKIKLIKKMEMIKTHRKEQTIRFTFPPVSRSGRVTVAIEGLAKGYDEKTLYKNLNLTVMRGERVGVIGPNGSGKTTLLRMIASEIDPDQGEIKLGHGVTMNYYAQHHSEILDPGKTVIEEVYQIVPHQTISFVRGICGAFLFSGEDVDKAVRILSGGEKARVCLAKILVKPGNLLVMDEPTNHLDLISSEILIDAFTDFNGTLVFVSHNQSFANRLATKIWDIRDGHILEYPGTLYEYYDYQAGLDNNSSTVPKHDTETVEDHFKESPLKDKDNRKLKRKEKAEKRHHISATLKPIRSKLTQLEERISGLEQRGRELEIILAEEATFKDKKNSVPLLKEYSDVKKKIDELMLRWESHQEQLESAKKELGV